MANKNYGFDPWVPLWGRPQFHGEFMSVEWRIRWIGLIRNHLRSKNGS